MDAQPRRWGAYFLIRPLGGGGMGDVYLALGAEPDLDKLCVVKRLAADTLGSADRVKRFRREAEIARTLSHEVIAQTLAINEFEGEPFIAQEFIEGKNITQLLSAARSAELGTFPVEIAVHIVREVARALAYAHGAGVVHRDVAPDNVMVTFDGQVRLIDFGIARAVTDATMTAPGTIVGRLSYAAPEVLAGRRADQRADVYAAGVVLWELVTGRPPAFAERDKPLAPSSLRPDLPASLDAAVLQAIAADPEARFATADAFQRALGTFLPANFDGAVALKGFVARCYDLDLQRRRLADEVAEAKALRAQLAPPSKTDKIEIPRQPRGVYVLAGLGGLALAVAGYALVRPRSAPGELAPVSPPAVASPVPTLPPVPPPAPPAAVHELPAPGPSPVVGAEPPRALGPRLAPVGRAPAAKAASPTRRSVAGVAASALLDRARDSLRAGDLVAAERDARQALDSASASQKANAHLILGKVLVLQGETGAASGEFAAALELDPGNEAASTALGRLQRRRP
jgi:serine/threonine protein kinase